MLYICSNADIARQNIRRLNVTGRDDFQLASRITMLPTVIGDLRNNRVNFVSFTPTTSFDLHSSEGVRDERAVLYGLLHQAWGFRDAIGPLHVLQGQVASTEDFRRLTQYYQQRIEPTLRDAFLAALDAHNPGDDRPEVGLRARFDELRECYRRVRNLGGVPPTCAPLGARWWATFGNCLPRPAFTPWSPT